MQNRLYEKYKNELTPKLLADLKLSTVMEVPRLKKIVSIGGARTTEAKDAYKTNEVYFVTEGSIKKATYSSYTKQNQDVVEIYPVDSKGKRRVWRWSDRKKILLHATQGDFVVKDVKDVYSIYLKDRL
ncbi:MAG: hypothetical protein UX69_C0018G0001, partial [candidate division WWE3 bacterium GW2011_GWA2_46_9]